MSHGEDKLRYLEKISLGGVGDNNSMKEKIIKGNRAKIIREKERKKKQICPKIFTVFRRPKFGSPRIKVGLLDESYA